MPFTDLNCKNLVKYLRETFKSNCIWLKRLYKNGSSFRLLIHRDTITYFKDKDLLNEDIINCIDLVIKLNNGKNYFINSNKYMYNNKTYIVNYKYFNILNINYKIFSKDCYINEKEILYKKLKLLKYNYNDCLKIINFSKKLNYNNFFPISNISIANCIEKYNKNLNIKS